MSDLSFLTVCLNPTLQKTIVLKNLWENEVNRSGEYYLDASGKGVNVSRVLVQLGENVIHLTQAGGRNKNLFLDLAGKDRVICRTVDSHSDIRFCYTLLNQEKRTTTEIVEEAEGVDAGTEKAVYREFLNLLPGCHTVIVSGSKAANFSDELFPQMVKTAKEAGKTVILDYRGKDLLNSLRFRPDIIKPNLSEFMATFFPDLSFREQDDPTVFLDRIREKMVEINDCFGTCTVLTRGKDGVLFYKGHDGAAIPADLILPVNTIGCGDAFTAGMASSWRKSHDMDKAVRKGLECAKKNALLIRPGVIV